MQTLMELIKTCINKGPNANPSDVSLNASPSVLIGEVITKAPVSIAALDVRKANDSQPKKVKGEQLCGIAKSNDTKNYGGTMFRGGEGDHHYLLLKALLIYAQEGPYMIKLLVWKKYIDIVTIVTKAPTKWRMYFISYLPLKARMLFGDHGSVSR